jgi:hypothetical protein
MRAPEANPNNGHAFPERGGNRDSVVERVAFDLFDERALALGHVHHSGATVRQYARARTTNPRPPFCGDRRLLKWLRRKAAGTDNGGLC